MNPFRSLKEKISNAVSELKRVTHIVKTQHWSDFKQSAKTFVAHPSIANLAAMGRNGAVLIAAVVALGVLTIVIPIVYLVSVQVGNTLPAGGLTNGQSSTLATLINNGGAALQLTTVSETVVGAGIILLGIYLFFQFRGR